MFRYSSCKKGEASKWDKYNKWYNNGKPIIRCPGGKVKQRFPVRERSCSKGYWGIKKTEMEQWICEDGNKAIIRINLFVITIKLKAKHNLNSQIRLFRLFPCYEQC